MNEDIRITLEEWFGDNGIYVTQEQLKELQEAIEITQEMRYTPNRSQDIIKKDNEQINLLKNQINMLERFLESKWLRVIVHDNYIERPFERNMGGIYASDREIFR